MRGPFGVPSATERNKPPPAPLAGAMFSVKSMKAGRKCHRACGAMSPMKSMKAGHKCHRPRGAMFPMKSMKAGHNCHRARYRSPDCELTL